MVEAHGGAITAENRPGGGATVRFTLPLELAPEPPPRRCLSRSRARPPVPWSSLSRTPRRSGASCAPRSPATATASSRPTTGGEGLQAAATRQPDLVILDLGLPDIDGLEVIRRLREWTAVPILVLSARGQEADKVAALDAGADDYVAKPFGVGELLARMRVVLRHAERTVREVEAQAYEAGDLVVDFARRRVSVKGEDVHLTPIEYRLLTTLIKHAGKVLTHKQLLKEVWGAPTRTSRTMSTSTWPSSGGSSSPIPPGPATC